MSNRHLSRSVALQTLFEFDVRDNFTLLDDQISVRLASNIEEFAPGLKDAAFAENIVRGVLSKHNTLDELIVKAAPDWPLEKIPNTDRNILRIGLFELLFQDHTEVPPKVAIDEAIELGKSFGGEATARFINGVLGRVYKEMGEPGKADMSKHAKKKQLDMTNLHTQNLVGTVVYARVGEEIHLALVHDIFGHWTLSKGKTEEGEELEIAVVRKVQDEIGLAVVVQDKLGENEYISSHPEFKKIRKHVHHFLSQAEYTPLVFTAKKGLDNAKWCTLSEIPSLNIYDDILPIIAKAVELITARK
jgi:transcription antitermination protein NusB